MIISILICACIGLVVACYAYYTESQLKNNPNYKPACDISDRISCSKPIQSEYANLFFMSNATVAILYYLTVIGLAYFDTTKPLFFLTLGGFVASLGLAYLLYFKIKSLCIVCTALYVVNSVLLYLSYVHYYY